MMVHSEIKDFVRKALLLGILLSFLVNLVFTYYQSLGSSSDVSAQTTTNDTSFKRVGVPYLGDTGVALSLNVGLKKTDAQSTPVRLYQEVMPIAEVLSDKGVGQKKVISGNMVAANEYLNILRTDVNKLLAQSSDREATLESFMDQLSYRYKTTNSYLAKLNAQQGELQSAITASDQRIETIRATLTTAYKSLDYDKTEESIDRFLKEKQSQTYAQTYLVFVVKFISTYSALNNYNKLLMDTLQANREALIKNVTVVLPDSGTQLMKKLNLVKTQTEANAASN